MKKLLQIKQIEALAKTYVWWESPAWAIKHPKIFLANLMDKGTWQDIQLARKIIGDDALRKVLLDPPVGYFHYRSWDYWHRKFKINPIPLLPKRAFA